MTNFFEEAAFALLDPTSLSVHQSSSSFSTSFHSFSSLSDIDVSALGLGLNESRERQIKSSESLDASPSLCPQDDSFHSDNSSVDFYSIATSRIRENVGSSSPSDSLSPLLNTTSLASAYCSGPAATTSNSYHFNLPPSVVNAGGHHPSSNGYQSFLYMDGGIHYGNAPYSQPALSHKTSVESFASSTSDVLQTPRSTWCHPWDELSMPSGHQFIPGQSPAPPPLSYPSSSRSRAGSPRRDRVLSLKSSMPSLVEEEVYHPSQGMGTLPECQTGDRGDEVFFFAVGPDDYPSEETSQGSLLPAAAVTGHGNRGYHVQAPTFASQATFEQVANDYLVDGSDGRQHWTSQHPGHSVLVGSALNPNAYVISDDPDGLRPLTAPESGSEEGISATATAVMRKCRSNDPRARRSYPSSPANLFTFQEREFPQAPVSESQNPSKAARQGRVSRQRSPGELFATEPIDDARAALSIQVLPLSKSTYQPGYFHPQSHFHHGVIPPITPEEQAFPFHTPSNLKPMTRYAYTANMEDLSMSHGSFQTPPQTGRAHSTDSTGSSIYPSQAGPAMLSAWQQPRTISMGTPSVMQCPPLQRSVSYGSISGWSDTTSSHPISSIMTSVAPTIIQQRAIAPLPVPKKRNPSNSTPKARKPSTRKAKAAAPNGFACSFINFTQDDAEKLLTGVAPSGSAKRRREASSSADEDLAKRAKK